MILAPAVLLLAVLGAGVADPKGGLEKRLAAPLSPGAVALLAPDASDAAVVGRLAAALRDPNPQTRAAAARVIMVTPVRDLQNAVEDALAEEFDAEAAREQIRALAVIVGPAGDARLLEAADRFEGRLDPDMARILARERGPGAIAYLLSARRWNLTPKEWANAAWLAARGNADSLVPALARALGTGDRKNWDALLKLFVQRDLVAGRSVVAAGLRSPVPGVAARAAWYLAWARLKEPLDTDRALVENWVLPEGADPDAIYFFDLLHRTFLEPPGDATAWIASLDTANASLADEIGPTGAWLSAMTPAERDAVRRRYDRRRGSSKNASGTPWDAPSKKPAARQVDGFALRTVSGLPKGVPADALRVGGCKMARGKVFGLAAVQYGQDGRPREIQSFETRGFVMKDGKVFKRDGASDACEAVALALVTMTLAPDSEFPIGTRPAVLFGAARSDCLAALEEPDVCPSVCPEERGDDVVWVDGSVEPPVLVDRVEPNYGEALRRERKQGVVIVEAVIGVDGCVREVRVIKSADPSLDLEGARAVAQWKYRPARRSGIPVSVYLTVTVTFKLNA